MSVATTEDAKKYVCLSGDTKPTTAPEGSICIVADTPAVFMMVTGVWRNVTALFIVSV